MMMMGCDVSVGVVTLIVMVFCGAAVVAVDDDGYY